MLLGGLYFCVHWYSNFLLAKGDWGKEANLKLRRVGRVCYLKSNFSVIMYWSLRWLVEVSYPDLCDFLWLVITSSYCSIHSETNQLDQLLCFQLWEKGFFKDSLLGSAWIPLMQIHHSNAEGSGAWIQMSNESAKGLMSSGHLLLVDTRFELPSGKQNYFMKGWNILVGITSLVQNSNLTL